MTLTKTRRARLEKLADYLEGLPRDYQHFDMRDYVQNPDLGVVMVYVAHNGGVATCGTAACAAGHGPAAGILMPPRFRAEMDGYGLTQDHLAWNRYTSLFVGWDHDRRYANNQLFEWLFGGSWYLVDNHHWGAAARIRYLLAHGKPPSVFDSDDDCCWSEMPDIYAPFRCDSDSGPSGRKAEGFECGAPQSGGSEASASPNPSNPSSAIASKAEGR